jgi:peptide/nickel transport system substrate-binding protein
MTIKRRTFLGGVAASGALATLPWSLSRADAAGKPFVAVLSQNPDTIDLSSATNAPSVAPVMENVNEPLVGRDAHGQPAPGLATWEVSADGKTITFHLRKGVKFHNGDDFTADDVIFSVNRMREKVPTYKRNTATLDRVEAVDPSTVRFILKRPSVDLIYGARGATIVSKAYHERVGEKSFTAHPVGTGPYKFVDYRFGQYLDLAAFEGYWGGAPHVKNVRLRFIPEDSTRVAALQSGEADIVMNTPFDRVAGLKAAGFKTVGANVHPTTSVQFTFGNPKAPWSDVRVRRALAYAIDDSALVDKLFDGIPKHYALFAPHEVGYDPDIKPYPYDPAKARALLKEAGYPNGFEMKLIYWSGNYVGMRQTAEAVTLFWQALGIKVKADAYDPPHMMQVLRSTSAHRDKTDFVLLSPLPIANYSDPAYTLNFVFNSHSPFSTYVNHKFDAIVAEADATLDNDKRAALVRKASGMLHDDVGCVPLWNNVSVFAMKSNVSITPIDGGIALLPLKNVSVS